MFHPCHQFGFLPGRPTIQQLLCFFITFLMLCPVANKLILYSYLYFLKAFNSVSHGKLLLKLWLLGQGSMELVPVLSFEPQSMCACILMVQYLSYYLFYLVCPGEYPGSCTFYNDLSLSNYHIFKDFLFADDAKLRKHIV